MSSPTTPDPRRPDRPSEDESRPVPRTAADEAPRPGIDPAALATVTPVPGAATSFARPRLLAREPIREVWSQAWPTVLTMTSFTIMQFVDKLMVGQVGYVEVAAQGNGGIWAFTPIAVLLGFLTVINTFVSQNLGAGRSERAPVYAWSGLWLSLATWAVILVPLAIVMPTIFRAMATLQETSDPERLIALQTTYARILLFGGFITLAARSMHHYFFGLHRPRVITASAIVGNLTNIGANFILIFGEEGVRGLDLPFLAPMDIPGIPGTPALGLAGAAIGTLIGTAVEVSIPLAIFLGRRMNAELATRGAWRPDFKAFREIFRVGWPAAIQYGNELVCWSIFMTILVGTFGEMHMSAGWIALQYMHLSFMPAVGFSTAVNAIVGRYIGAGDPDTAVQRAHLGVLMGVVYMTACAVLFVVFRHPMIAVFVGGETTPEEAAQIVAIGGKLMICAAVFQTCDAVGIVYMGALRGAGDTVWPGIVTMFLSWTCIVGGGILMIWQFPQYESIGPWVGASLYIIVLGGAMAWRFESGHWRSIDLLGRGDAAAATATTTTEATDAADDGTTPELRPS